MAQIPAQEGADVVHAFLDELKHGYDELPAGLKGARMVFPATDNNTPTACLEK